MSEPEQEPGPYLDRQRRLQSLSREFSRESEQPTKSLSQNLAVTASLAEAGRESVAVSVATTPHDLAAKRPGEKRHFVGRYEIVGHLGTGGMGIVFRAHDPDLKRDVAVKMLHNGVNDTRLARRFMVKAQAIARLERHSNIVKVHGVDRDHCDIPYYVMEYVAGGTLAAAAKQLREDRAKLVGILAKVCRAVAYMHEMAVSHRDLKPLNILLTETDEPMVADFGLAKLHDNDPGFTQNDSLLGTRVYMSPEQTRGKAEDLGPACDIWSLGVVLYEMVSGRLPFHSKDQTELFELIETADPAPLTWADGTPEPQLDAVVRTALVKDPAKRCKSATTLAEDLERWLAGVQVVAKPPRRGWSGRRWALAAALLAGLMGAAVWGLAPAPAPSAALTLVGPTDAGIKFTPVNISDFKTGVDADGHFAIDAGDGTTILQLTDQTFPRGAVLEAQVGQTSSPFNSSFVGVYCNGTASGSDFYCAVLRMDQIARAGMDLARIPPNKSGVSFDTGVWDGGRLMLLPHGPHIPATRIVTGSKLMPRTKLRLAIATDGTVTPSLVDGTVMTPLSSADCLDNWSIAAQGANRTTAPAAAGSGIGLIVERCSASVWDVILRPQ